MKRLKTDWTCGGSEAVTAPRLLVVSGLAGQQHACLLARHHDAWHDRPDLAAACVLEQRVGGVEARELLEVLDRWEHQQELAVGRGLERPRRRVPPRVDHL